MAGMKDDQSERCGNDSRNEKLTEERVEINEERSRNERVVYTWADAIIDGWQRNPTLPNHFRTDDGKEIKKFG